MASFSRFIGFRYGFSKQRSRFSTFVSMASMLGMALGVASLITVLSVMNGFGGELRGRILADESIARETTTTSSGSTSTSVEYYFPMVHQAWKGGDPVYWVVQTPELTDAEVQQMDPQAGIGGTLRDILWEGLDDMVVEWALDRTGRYAATRFTSVLQPTARAVLGGALRLVGR